MLKDRVEQTSSTTGTGTYSLTGAVANRLGFIQAGFQSGTQVYYLAVDNAAGGYEVGIGTITDLATDTLSRDEIIISSNGNLAVNWPGAGPRNIMCIAPAETFGNMGWRLLKGAVGGTANAITVTNKIPLRNLKDGAVLIFDLTADTTGAVQVNPDGLGLTSLRDAQGVAFSASYTLKSGQTVVAIYKQSTGFFHVVSHVLAPPVPVQIISGATHAPTAADSGVEFLYTAAGGCVVTLPSTAGLPSGWQIGLTKLGGVVTLNRSGTDSVITKATPLTQLLLPGNSDGGQLIADPATTRFIWRGKRSIESTPQTITASTAIVFPHTLGVMPDWASCMIRNVSGAAKNGYAANDEVLMIAGADRGSVQKNFDLQWDSTNVNVAITSIAASMSIYPKGGGASAALTNADWGAVIRAFVIN
jgi:hypothetical protein